MQAIRERVTRAYLALMALATAAMCAVYGAMAQSSHAAASPTTGIDYVTDLVSPVKSELTLAIVAGLTLLVVLIAVRVGVRFIKGFAK
jgi:hypothetical protein